MWCPIVSHFLALYLKKKKLISCVSKKKWRRLGTERYFNPNRTNRKPSVAYFDGSWDWRVSPIPTYRVGKWNSSQISQYKHDTLGGSVFLISKKTQRPKHCESHWFHFTQRYFLLPPNKPLQPYVCVCVCMGVCVSLVMCVSVCMLSPIAKKSSETKRSIHIRPVKKKKIIHKSKLCKHEYTSLNYNRRKINVKWLDLPK